MQKNLPFIPSKSFFVRRCQRLLLRAGICLTAGLFVQQSQAQTLAFPEALGFGRYAKGARGAATQEVYIVTNLNDSGAGSFRDAVSKQGRIVVFAVGGIVNLLSDIVVQPNVTIAGQTAPGDGIVFFGKRVTFSGSSNTIARYLRIRLGATGNSGKDASGISNGNNMIFDHMSFTWGMDEVFSINWDGKNSSPDNITIQNSIIGQGLHRENHSAGGLIQTPDGGKVSLLRNLYISNKTRNPKVKGVNEFVNNVIYNWGNGNRLGDQMNYGWSGEGYIMGGSSGVSEVNIINNYFMSGPLTPPSEDTPFSRGTGTFNLFGSGNYFDANKNGVLDGNEVPYDNTGYPGITTEAFKTQAFPYPEANPALSAAQAYQYVIDNVGANYPRRDQLDDLLVDEVKSYGVEGRYVYRETDVPLSNGGVGQVFGGPAPLDSDADGMPDVWEDTNGLNKNDKADATAYSLSSPEYLNIEVYVNSLVNTAPPAFIKSPSGVTLNASSQELPSPASTVVINWVDNSDNEDHFVIERSTDGINYTDIHHAATDVTTYTDNGGLVPNTTYYYRLKAVSAADASGYSHPVAVTTPPIPTAPSVTGSPSPANTFQYAEPASGALALKWTGSSNTTTYEVYFGTDPANLVKKGELPYVASPSFNVSDLSANTTYYWRVDASNDKGLATGTVWSFRTIKNIAPGLVGYWSFDESQDADTRVTDSTDFENHGILGLNADNSSVRVPGKVKNALDLATADPNLYVVSIPNEDQLFLNKKSFSISFWMKAPSSLLPPDNSSSSYLLCKGSITRNASTGATGKRFDIEFKNKQLRFAIDDDNDAGGGGKDEIQVDGNPFFVNDWVHVVAIRDSANKKLRVYRNGALVKEQTITKAFAGIGEASALAIGNIGELEFLSTTNAPAPYKGMLDELKVFNYALSPQQVMEQFYTSDLPLQAYQPSPASGSPSSEALRADVSWLGGINTSVYKLYLGTSPDNLNYVADVPVNTNTYQFTGLNQNTTYYWRVDAQGNTGTTSGNVWSFTTPFAPGIVGDWKLDATTGTVITDNSTFLNHGALENVSDYSWEAGRINNSLNLKTVDASSAIRIPNADHMKFDKNPFSISMWIKGVLPASSSTSSYLLHKGTFARNATTGATGKWFGVEFKNNTIYWSVDDDATKSAASVSSTNFLNNSWNHVLFVRDIANKLLKIYLNGTLAVSATDNTGVANGIGGIEPLFIANSNNLDVPFKGAIDEVKLFNYVLSYEQISTLASGGTVLPVSLGSFNAKAEENKVRIDWSTLSELNNDKFIAEKSLDGLHFQVLGSLAGRGTASGERKYSVSDFNPVRGTNYYRLSQVDLDGKVTVLGVKSVRFQLSPSTSFSVYPNPATNLIHIRLPELNSGKIDLKLMSLDGKIVQEETLQSHTANNGIYTLSLQSKPESGAYILSLSGGGFRENVIVLIR